jgi:uncharacterized protein YgbK (DUF1537 family)
VTTSRLALLADDLTGAADTGAAFAAVGRRTVVLLSPDAPIPPDADVLVMTSESRALPPDDGDEATRRCASHISTWIGDDASARGYVKIDSTLRGHPVMALAVVMDGLGVRGALVAPAFPAQGRTTVRGRQCVNGVPLEATTFGGEVPTSDLAVLFGANAPERVVRLSRDDLQHGTDHVARLLAAEDRVWIADVEDDADLAMLAAAALASPLRVLCGSAGLARALAHRRSQGLGGRGWSDDRAGLGEPALPSRDEGRGPVLVVTGSRHSATAAQVEALRESGALVVSPDASYLTSGAADQASATAARIVDGLAAGRVTVLATSGLPAVDIGGAVVAARLAAIVAAVCARVSVSGLVLTGGDTAAAVCAALGSTSLWLTGELQPGIATATLIGGRHPDLAIVTKAGGFGDDGALVDAVTYLAPGAAAD